MSGTLPWYCLKPSISLVILDLRWVLTILTLECGDGAVSVVSNLERRGLLIHFHRVLKRNMTSYLIIACSSFCFLWILGGRRLFIKSGFIDILKLPVLAIVILILGTQKVS